MANKKPSKVCADCIHFHACQSWTSGILDDTDARPCRNYETVVDSNAYYMGYQAGRHDMMMDFLEAKSSGFEVYYDGND